MSDPLRAKMRALAVALVADHAPGSGWACVRADEFGYKVWWTHNTWEAHRVAAERYGYALEA